MLGRREIGVLATGAAFAPWLASANAAQGIATADSVARGLVKAFYTTHNAGHFGSLDSLFDDFSYGQSSAGYFVPSSSTGVSEGAEAGFEELGGRNGIMESKDEVVSFLEARQRATKRVWKYDEHAFFMPSDDYLVSWVTPSDISFRGIPIPFMHVFLLTKTEVDDAIIDCKIRGFFETRVTDIGRNNG